MSSDPVLRILPVPPIVQHHNRTGNAKPIKQRVYRTSHHHCKEIEKQVKEMLQNGIIEPSVSPVLFCTS